MQNAYGKEASRLISIRAEKMATIRGSYGLYLKAYDSRGKFQTIDLDSSMVMDEILEIVAMFPNPEGCTLYIHWGEDDSSSCGSVCSFAESNGILKADVNSGCKTIENKFLKEFGISLKKALCITLNNERDLTENPWILTIEGCNYQLPKETLSLLALPSKDHIIGIEKAMSVLFPEWKRYETKQGDAFSIGLYILNEKPESKTIYTSKDFDYAYKVDLGYVCNQEITLFKDSLDYARNMVGMNLSYLAHVVM